MKLNEVLSRFATLGFLLSGLAFQGQFVLIARGIPALIAIAVLPTENCTIPIVVSQTFFSIALPISTYLFFFRISTVFSRSKSTVWFFIILRHLITAGLIVQSFGVTASHIGTTKKCVLVQLRQYCAAGTLAVALNDTVGILVVSLQLLRNSTADTWHAKWEALFRGRGMGQVSRILLRTGQQYYM